jgi:predicted transposase/invertase (TIGR01784 family)
MGSNVKHKNPEVWKDRFVSEYTFREKLTNELQDDTIFIIFAELRRFNKQLRECESDLEKMLYIIKNGWRLKNQPKELKDEIFTRLFCACDIPRFDEAKRIQYEKDMFDERRYNGELAAARTEGRTEGIAEGEAMGQRLKAIEIAQKLIASGMSKVEAAEFVGLSEDDL